MNILLKMNNEYYNVAPDTYDRFSKKYIGSHLAGASEVKLELQKSSLTINQLFADITIGGETFKPVDKFNDFQIVTSDEADYGIRGSKVHNELIVMSHSVNLNNISRISGFDLESNDGDLSIVFSIDDGHTWLTQNGDKFETINISIPTAFENLTVSEIENWENAKGMILKFGITYEQFRRIDVNGLNPSKIKIAIVIGRCSKLVKAGITYDEYYHITKAKKNEYQLLQYEKSVRIKSAFDCAFVGVNVMTKEMDIVPFYNQNEIPSLIAIQDGNNIRLKWDEIQGVQYYIVYLDGVAIRKTSKREYNYSFSGLGTFHFFVRAFYGDIRSSIQTNIAKISMQRFLADNQENNFRYLLVKMDGEYLKLSVQH